MKKRAARDASIVLAAMLVSAEASPLYALAATDGDLLVAEAEVNVEATKTSDVRFVERKTASYNDEYYNFYGVARNDLTPSNNGGVISMLPSTETLEHSLHLLSRTQQMDLELIQ